MKPDTRSWILVLALSAIAAAVELWLVWEYQLAHSISDESTIGGPCLALGTVFLMVLVGAIMARRVWLSVVSAVLSAGFLVLSYVFLIQW